MCAVLELLQIVRLCSLFTSLRLGEVLVSFVHERGMSYTGQHFFNLLRVRASPCESSFASRFFVWLHAAPSDLVTTLFVCDREMCVLLMKDFTTFTAAFETDVG
jgi:hypothetical protein